MSLLETIEADLIAALKSGDHFKRDTLRFLKSVLKNSEIESAGGLTDDRIVSLIQKETKKRSDAQEIYIKAGKTEMARNEAGEIELLKKYLPSQLDEAQLLPIISEYLTANPTEIGQIGTAMGVLSPKLKGRADMGLVSKILRQQILNG